MYEYPVYSKVRRTIQKVQQVRNCKVQKEYVLTFNIYSYTIKTLDKTKKQNETYDF